jgi:hypothetical protein
MRIDLHNFFQYYDPKNPKHVAAVEQLEVDLAAKQPDLMEDNANWVRIFRTPNIPPKPSGILLNVPWYPQTDNFTLPDSTCNSSACAMCLEFLKPGSLPAGPKGDDAYLRKVLAVGKSTDQSVQTQVLKGYGINSVFRTNLDFSNLDRELTAGRPIVLGILHRGPTSNPTRNSGHMIACIGKTDKGDYVMNDPYGSLHDGYTKAVVNGRQVVYSRMEMEKRWTADGPKSGWGRIFEPVKK